MTTTKEPETLGIHSIFHPSDFSEASETAFAHALKITLLAKGRLTVLHAARGQEVRLGQFPSVRNILQRWGVIPEGSSKSAVASLGIDVHKVVAEGRDPVHACAGFLEDHPTDLVVLAVRHHEGRMRWFQSSVGEPIARASGEMTLFLPHGVGGFVSLQDGSVSLERILIPVTKKPSSQPSINAVDRLIRALDLPKGMVQLLHVGEGASSLNLETPGEGGWDWSLEEKPGDPVSVILNTARDWRADLIVMSTDGPDGFLDGLRGTTSERVLRQSQVPILNIPAGSLFG